MSASITITGLDAVVKRFNIDPMTVVKPAALTIGHEIHTFITTDPGPVSQPIRWASEKQRRWYFWHRLKDKSKGGPFGLPYTRENDPDSQKLRQSWTVEPTPTGALVGTRVLYAPWVQSSTPTPWGGPQSEQNRLTGWSTDEDAVRKIESEGLAVKAVQAAIVAALGG